VSDVLTLQHLETYAAFRGDADGWARRGGSPAMEDRHWRRIDELLHGLHLVRCGLASPRYAARIEQRLQALTADEKVRDRLRSMAGDIA